MNIDTITMPRHKAREAFEQYQSGRFALIGVVRQQCSRAAIGKNAFRGAEDHRARN